MNMEDGGTFMISLVIKRRGKATLRAISKDVELMGHPISYRRMLGYANHFEHIGFVDKVRKKPIRLKVKADLLKPLTTVLEAVINEGKSI